MSGLDASGASVPPLRLWDIRRPTHTPPPRNRTTQIQPSYPSRKHCHTPPEPHPVRLLPRPMALPARNPADCVSCASHNRHRQPSCRTEPLNRKHLLCQTPSLLPMANRKLGDKNSQAEAYGGYRLQYLNAFRILCYIVAIHKFKTCTPSHFCNSIQCPNSSQISASPTAGHR